MLELKNAGFRFESCKIVELIEARYSIGEMQNIDAKNSFREVVEYRTKEGDLVSITDPNNSNPKSMLHSDCLTPAERERIERKRKELNAKGLNEKEISILIEHFQVLYSD